MVIPDVFGLTADCDRVRTGCRLLDEEPGGIGLLQRVTLPG